MAFTISKPTAVPFQTQGPKPVSLHIIPYKSLRTRIRFNPHSTPDAIDFARYRAKKQNKVMKVFIDANSGHAKVTENLDKEPQPNTYQVHPNGDVYAASQD